MPVITNQPLSVTNLAGSTATFSVGAEGTPPLAYQWWFAANGVSYAVAGDTNAFVTMSNLHSVNAGSYWVVVTNLEGAATSIVATLTVLTPLRILTQPANQTASLFADATFRVNATGDAPLTYQWRFNGADLPGMTSAILSLTNIQRANAGNYDVVVTNVAGSLASRIATLTIVPFNSIYCFGYSWTGTSGLAPDGSSCNWDAPRYYLHRASNGPLWPEYLSTNLGLAYVGGNNYGQCGATAPDILNQVVSFRVPPKPQLSLYFLWAGDSDFLRAYPHSTFGNGYISVTNEIAWNRLIQTLILSNSNAVNRLYDNGARTIVFETQIDCSQLPGALIAFGTNTAGLAKLSEYTRRFNTEFMEVMQAFQKDKPDLRILPLDFIPRFNDVILNPERYGLTKTNIDALDDPALADKSLTGSGADYVFWDLAHATTKIHELISAWHLEALTNAVLETLDATLVRGSPSVHMNHLLIGRDYTLQSSSDLKHWDDVRTFTAAAGTNVWTGGVSGGSARFYRLKWQP